MIKNLLKVLYELGDTEEQIAESLRVLGIQGIRQQEHYCPIAKYIESKGFTGARVMKEVIYCFSDAYTWSPYPMLCRTTLPAHVQNFIKKFDSGEFEFLNLPLEA